MAAKGKQTRAKPAAKSARKRAAKQPPLRKPAAAPKTPRASPGPKPASVRPAKGEARPAKPARTMPVHALADDRVHLAVEHRGRLKQGRLKTLCGLQAVSALSPFVLADKAQKRCRTCFGKIDADGLVRT